MRKPKWIQSWAQLRDGGVKHLLKQKGWKVVFVFSHTILLEIVFYTFLSHGLATITLVHAFKY